MKIKILSISDLQYQYTGDISPFNKQNTAKLISPIEIIIEIEGIPNTLSFSIPTGFVTDFGTIPEIFQWIVHPRGTSDRAYVVHDWLCVSQILPQIISDNILKEIMIMDGTEKIESNLAYIGVRFYDIVIRKHPKKIHKLLSDNKKILDEYFKHNEKILL